MVKISLNSNKICFMPYSKTLSIKKQTLPPPPKKKNKGGQKKGGGGVKGSYDRGQRFNVFFKVFLITVLILILSISHNLSMPKAS